MKKYIGLLFAGVILAAAMTGCGPKEGEGTDTTSGTTTSTTGADATGPSKPSTDAGTTTG